MNKIPYGMTSDGLLKHIDDVPNGKECNCFCPDCHCRLIAKNLGRIMDHHFAHVTSSNCEFTGETVIHRFAKDILTSGIKVELPPIKYNEIVIQNPNSFDYSIVKLEERIDSIIPDVLLENENGDKLYIEIFVYHGVDSKKMDKIKQMNINCIEIRLNDLVNSLFDQSLKNQIEDRVINQIENKIWVYNKYITEYENYKFGTIIYFQKLSLNQKNTIMIRNVKTNIILTIINGYISSGFDWSWSTNERAWILLDELL